MNWTEMPIPPRDRILSDGGDFGSYQDELMLLPQKTWVGRTTQTYAKSYSCSRSWDTVTPGWKDRLNKGEILNFDFLSVNTDATMSPTLWEAEWTVGTQRKYWWGGGKPVTMPNTPPTFSEVLGLVATDGGSLRAEAVTSSFSRVDVSELEVLASLGEMPETVDWFKDVLKRVIAVTVAVKRRDAKRVLNELKKARRQPGQAARKWSKSTFELTENGWMELRYAIRPLVFEVQAYLNALESKIENAKRKTARKKTFSTVTDTTSTSCYYWLPSTAETEETTSRSISAGVIFQLKPEHMTWFTHLGLDAPISAVWAVTSLSFVYDWFFNIAEWIASWEPRLGLTPLANWVVETRTIEKKTRIIPGSPSKAAIGYTSLISYSVKQAGEAYCKTQIKARWANPDRQVLPTFRFKGLGTAQIVDLSVILRKIASQLFR